jgi:hypothetical protein
MFTIVKIIAQTVLNIHTLFSLQAIKFLDYFLLKYPMVKNISSGFVYIGRKVIKVKKYKIIFEIMMINIINK